MAYEFASCRSFFFPILFLYTMAFAICWNKIIITLWIERFLQWNCTTANVIHCLKYIWPHIKPYQAQHVSKINIWIILIIFMQLSTSIERFLFSRYLVLMQKPKICSSTQKNYAQFIRNFVTNLPTFHSKFACSISAIAHKMHTYTIFTPMIPGFAVLGGFS